MRPHPSAHALALLASGLLLGTVLAPTFAAESRGARIDQTAFISIGGIDQWISIRGEDRNNPVLLVVTGQVASWNAVVDLQFDLALARARKDGDAAAITQLETTGRPDPRDATRAFSMNVWPAMAAADRAWIQALRAQVPELRAKYPQDFQAFEDGFEFSAEHALPYQMKADLPTTSSMVDTAFFLIQGEDDVMTPTKAAVDYFNVVAAPKKELILIANAGHFAFMTSSDAFLAALTYKVRPVAIERGG